MNYELIFLTLFSVFVFLPLIFLFFIYCFKKNSFIFFLQFLFYKHNIIYFSNSLEKYFTDKLMFLPHPSLNWSLNPNYKNIHDKLVHTKEGFRKTKFQLYSIIGKKFGIHF